MKVRGFQVAPAELEGHLLDHPDVADTCVVGVPDDYSGEVPFAFIMLESCADKRAKVNAAEAEKIKQSIMKVRHLIICHRFLNNSFAPLSTSPTRKCSISG